MYSATPGPPYPGEPGQRDQPCTQHRTRHAQTHGQDELGQTGGGSGLGKTKPGAYARAAIDLVANLGIGSVHATEVIRVAEQPSFMGDPIYIAALSRLADRLPPAFIRVHGDDRAEHRDETAQDRPGKRKPDNESADRRTLSGRMVQVDHHGRWGTDEEQAARGPIPVQRRLPIRFPAGHVATLGTARRSRQTAEIVPAHGAMQRRVVGRSFDSRPPLHCPRYCSRSFSQTSSFSKPIFSQKLRRRR